MMADRFVVAMDGPAAAGKGTLSRAVAAHFGFAHLDTGMLYRAVGEKVLRGAEPIAAARTLTADDLRNPKLRTPEVAQAASHVAMIPEVRAMLVTFQRQFMEQPGGAVLDGRDIGTVICPQADVKLFVTAAPRIRAMRRFVELSDQGLKTSFEDVLADVEARDARDMSRADSPLQPAADAIELDTSELSIDQAIAAAISLIDVVRSAQ